MSIHLLLHRPCPPRNFQIFAFPQEIQCDAFSVQHFVGWTEKDSANLPIPEADLKYWYQEYCCCNLPGKEQFLNVLDSDSI